MDFRHEWKFLINRSDMLILRQRLGAVARHDIHCIDGKYEIRSLYFDDLYDTALREKIDGVSRREKFRLRYYNGDTSYIALEKKSKINGLCRKDEVRISKEEAQIILDGNYDLMQDSNIPLVRELYLKTISKGLRPKTIVDYTREPFVYPAGNVRVTIDYNIRTGLKCTDFLNPRCVTVPVPDSPIILEVKWDGFLPDIISDAVSLTARRSSAFSKYAICRIYD